MRKILIVALLAWTGCGEQAKPAPTGAKPYPLKVCIVSGEELGKMGEPKVIVHEGREIKFCCPSCEGDFRKDPAKFLKKL